MSDPLMCSVADVVCDRCQRRAIVRGWRPEDVRAWQTLETINCGDCRERLERLAHGHSNVTLTTYGDLSAGQRRENSAVHEVAHAVIGEQLGLTMTHAALDTNPVVEGERFGGATVDFAPVDPFPVITTSLMLLAGPAAERQWLNQRGLTDQRHQFYAVYGASGDLATIAARCGEDLLDDGLLSQGFDNALELVNEHQREIYAVAAELNRLGRLDREAVLSAMRASHRSTRTPTTAPSAAPTPQPITTNTTGGTAMSNVDEIRAAVAQAQQDTMQVHSALQQAMGDLDRIRHILAHAFEGSTQSGTEDALGALGRAREQFHEVYSLLHIGITAAEDYAAGL